MIMKKIANLLLIAGVLVLLYPLADCACTYYWQQKLFNEWAAGAGVEKKLSAENGNFAAGETAGALYDGETEPSNSVWGLEITPLGILKIEKIELRLPILMGSNLANLKIGAGLMQDTAEPGAFGNTVLTAHRSYTYGRFFNRLDEIETGDEILIATRESTYQYIVYDKLIVEPTDTAIIKGGDREKILTLVTCHPVHKSTHRLIIQAKLAGETAP